MLPPRDPPQKKQSTQAESEGLEKNIPSTWTEKKKKKPWVAIFIQERIDFKKRAIGRDPEGHFIILHGRGHQ